MSYESDKETCEKAAKVLDNLARLASNHAEVPNVEAPAIRAMLARNERYRKALLELQADAVCVVAVHGCGKCPQCYHKRVCDAALKEDQP